MKDLNNKTAVITGAGGGLGRALSQALAKEGCHLALVDINKNALEIVRTGLCDDLRVSIHCCDIAGAEAVDVLRGEILDVHGSVDLLINNAGITLQKTFAGHSLQDWQRVMGVNWQGTVNLCHAFLPDLRRSGDAHIVNLSSMAAYAGLPSQSSYCASKAAIHSLSQTLRIELAADGIGVTSVHPGAIRTQMIQATLEESEYKDQALKNFDLAQRFGVTPERVAGRIVRAIERNKGSIRVGMDAHVLFGVSRLMPAGLNFLTARFFSGFQKNHRASQA